MSGANTSHSKVRRSDDEPISKMVLPDAVHHHTSGQRMIGSSQPLGKLPSSTLGLGYRNLFDAGQKSRDATSDHGSRIARFTAFLESDRSWLSLTHGVGNG